MTASDDMTATETTPETPETAPDATPETPKALNMDKIEAATRPCRGRHDRAREPPHANGCRIRGILQRP